MRYLKHTPWIAFLVALAPAFFAAWPLFGARFIPTHDGEYHIIRFWQFSAMLASGQWFPRWAPDLNNGLGIPLFTFNYPFPNYVGSLFHAFGLSFVDSFKWTMALGYLSAVVWCYAFAKKEFGTKAGVIAAIVFSYVPYWFVDIYVRGSVGEIWAMSFFMLSLVALAYRNTYAFPLAVAGIILSHNILAMLFVPLIFIISASIGSMVVYWFLGVGIASYFWLPALIERSYVVGLNTVLYSDHFPAMIQLLFPSWGNGYSVPGIGDQMSFQLGIVPLAVWVISFGMLVLRRLHIPIVMRRYGVFTSIIMFVATICMTEYSGEVWTLIPAFQYLQFPWRLLSVVVVATPVLTGIVAWKRPILGIVLAVCAVAFAYAYVQPVTYEPRADARYLTNPSFTGGTSSLGDAFQTRWIHGDVPGGFSFPDGTVTATKLSPVSYAASVRAGSPGMLTAPIAYYPGWQARLDGTDIPVTPDSNGRISVPVPEGTHDVVFRLGSTWWQIAASWISVISLSAAAVSYILKKRFV